MSEWERGSCDLAVSKNYKKVFGEFSNHYKSETKQIKDNSLNEELEILNLLQKSKNSDQKNDD